MIEGILITLPSLVSISGPLDTYHTNHPSKTHPARKTYSQILRFIQELYVHSLTYRDDDPAWKSILRHLMFLKRKCVESDPKGIHSMFRSSDIITRYEFPRPGTWGRFDVDSWVMSDMSYDRVVRFPAMGDVEIEGSCDGRIGSSMVRRGTKARSFLEKTGYLSREDRFDDVSIRSVGPDIFARYLASDYTSINTYHVIRDIPSWFIHVPGAL